MKTALQPFNSVEVWSFQQTNQHAFFPKHTCSPIGTELAYKGITEVVRNRPLTFPTRNRDRTLFPSKALKNQGTETTSILIFREMWGSTLTRTCRCRLLIRDNTSSIFHKRTNARMCGLMTTSTSEREDLSGGNVSPLSGAPCLWGRIRCKKGWDRNLQTETARDRKARCDYTGRGSSSTQSQSKGRHLQEPFWWWDFSHRHSGVYSFLWKHNISLTPANH